MPRTPLFITLLVAASLALVAVAGARTVPVGSPLGDEAGVEHYQQCVVTGCTLLQTTVEGHPVSAVPDDGTLTEFSAIGKGAVLFRVLRPALEPAGAYTPVYTSERVELTGGLTKLATRVPVKKGDLVGVDIPNGVDVHNDVVPYTATSVGVRKTAGSVYSFFEGQARDGVPAAFARSLQGALQVAAVVDVPGSGPDAVGTTGGSGGPANGDDSGTAGSGVPPHCVVPGLHGRSVKTARAALETRRCNLGRVKHLRGSGRGEWIVVRQAAKRGSHLKDRAKVNVVVRRARS